MSISNNLDIELYEVIDLVNETLKDTFIERWKFRYSEKFLKLFQLKLLSSLEKQKPLKQDKLLTYFTKNCGYSQEQVIDFFKNIDIEIYYPIILYGSRKQKTRPV
jgi:hypothetical protein